MSVPITPHDAPPREPEPNLKRPAFRLFPLLALLFATLASCASLDEYTAADGCNDVAASLADKALECTKSTQKANDLFDAFQASHTCSPAPDGEAALACQTKILSLACKADGSFSSSEAENAVSACGVFDLALGPDHGCALLGALLDELKPFQGAACASPPDGAGTWSQLIASTVTCKPTATSADYRRCVAKLGCSQIPGIGGAVATLAPLASKDCEGLIGTMADVDVCHWVIDGSIAAMSGACNLTTSYDETLAADLRQSLGCPIMASLSGVIGPCATLQSFCPNVGTIGPTSEGPAGETDAALLFTEQLYATGCISVFDPSDCAWRHGIESYVLGCTGDEAASHVTSAAFSAEYGCNRPALTSCLRDVPCPPGNPSPDVWIQTLSAACPVDFAAVSP